MEPEGGRVVLAGARVAISLFRRCANQVFRIENSCRRSRTFPLACYVCDAGVIQIATGTWNREISIGLRAHEWIVASGIFGFDADVGDWVESSSIRTGFDVRRAADANVVITTASPRNRVISFSFRTSPSVISWRFGRRRTGRRRYGRRRCHRRCRRRFRLGAGADRFIGYRLCWRTDRRRSRLR